MAESVSPPSPVDAAHAEPSADEAASGAAVKPVLRIGWDDRGAAGTRHGQAMSPPVAW